MEAVISQFGEYIARFVFVDMEYSFSTMEEIESFLGYYRGKWKYINVSKALPKFGDSIPQNTRFNSGYFYLMNMRFANL